MRNFTFLVFVILTFCCWGVYGPVLHLGQEALGGDGPRELSSLRPFICVGIAYFLIAVVYPLFVLQTKGETGSWSASGFTLSFIAGLVGAVGALGIILAFKFGGKPVYVMPLVFGLAPVVNTFVTMIMAGTFKQAKPIFYVGIALAALGAAGVLTFKPKPKPVAPVTTEAVTQAQQLTPVLFKQEVEKKAATDNDEKAKPAEETKAATSEAKPATEVAAKDASKKSESKFFPRRLFHWFDRCVLGSLRTDAS